MTASLFDITGLTAVSTFAVGLGFLPYQKIKTKKEFSKRVENLRLELTKTVSYHFEKELSENVSEIKSSISPYILYTKTEFELTNHSLTSLQDSSRDIISLQKEIDREFPFN